MSGIVGQIALSGIRGEVTTTISTDLNNHDWLGYQPTLWPIVAVNDGGDYGLFRSKSPQTTSVSGQAARSFSADFYHRVHISPSIISLGNAFENIQRDVSVWNAHLTPRLLGSISESGTAGMAMSGVPTPPLDFQALEERTYTISVDLSGPAKIDASYVFNFPSEHVTLSLVGSRVTVWPFPPNWATPVTESLEWKTQVIRSFDGSEQRRDLRTNARRSFSYHMLISGENTARFDNILWGWQNRSFAMPVWMDKRQLTQAANPDDLTISVSTVDRSFVAGGLAIIYGNEWSNELVEILTVTSGLLNLSRPVSGTWSVGTAVYPVVIGQLPTSVGIMRHSDQALSATIDFDTDPSVTDPYTPVAAAEVVYDTLEVSTRQPNWKSGIDNTSEYACQILDMGVGVTNHYVTEEFPRLSRTYQWLLKDRTEIRKMREMLGRRRGQLKPLYVPTWHRGFTVTAPIGSLSDTISVKHDDFLQMVGVDLSRDRIVIRLTGGEVFYRRILGVTGDVNGAVLNIDAPLGLDVNTDQIKSVSMLMRSRLATDKIDLVWHTDSVVVVNTPFITIKD